MERDPETEAGAIALCWIAKPGMIAADRMEWWQAQTNTMRDLYRLRASTVLEAVDELREMADAAG